MRRLVGIGMAVALGASVLTVPTAAQDSVTLNVATINNPDMILMSELASEFTEDTGINVEFTVLPDQELRQQVTQDVALGAGAYDIVTIGPNELRYAYAPNEWVLPMNPLLDQLDPELVEAYDLEDVIPPIRDGLTIDGQLYGLPFYGESSFTMYRKDLFEDASLTMPEQPTWDQIAEFAAALHDPDNDLYGVILKGIAQYGQLAPFMSYTYAHGLRWFDEDWQPQFATPEFKEAAQRYVDLVQTHGEPGASTVGFVEGLGLMSQGQAAMWVDATVAAGLLADPANSTVTDKIAYAMAPEQGCDKGHWLYSWNLAIAAASQHPVEAAQFILWATSKDYIDLVAETNGWEVIPPGTRISTYERPEYLEVAPWAELTLRSIETADEVQPSCLPTPYTGSTQVDIPEWPDIAFDFAQDLSAAVAGTKTVDEWLDAAQEKATEVLTDAGYIQ